MVTLHLGRPPHTRTITLAPAAVLAPLGLLLAAGIGLAQGRFQSTLLPIVIVAALAAASWIALVLAKPQSALLVYTLLAVNLNSFDLPLTLGGVRVSLDILLMSLLIVGVLLRLVTRRGSSQSLPITASYLVFLAVPIITLLWSPVKVESLRGIFRFVGYLALVWLIADVVRTPAQVRRMTAAIILSALVPIVSGFYQALTGSGQVIWAGAEFNRIYGLAGGPFTLAFYLVMTTPLALIFFLEGRTREEANAVEAGSSWHFNRMGLAVLLGMILLALVLTFIRGAWIAFVVSLLALGILRGSLRYRQLLLTIPAAVGLILLTFTPVLNRLTQVTAADSTLYGRLAVWRLAWDWLSASPLNLLAGLGMKAFEYYYILLAGPTTAGLYWRRESFLIGNRPHNEILGFMLDVGLIGTLAFVLTLFILIRLALRVYRRAPELPLRLIGLAFVIGSTGLLVGAMGDNVFSQPSVAVYFWIMAGLVIAIDRHMMPSAAEPPPP